MDTSLRVRLVAVALEWQVKFGIAPSITTALSEYDAALLVGCLEPDYVLQMQNRTAVTKGSDFFFGGKHYQVKANRPSGKKGSKPSITNKATNYNWDYLIWMLYDEKYVLLEAWLWEVEDYKARFHNQTYVRPNDLREGMPLFINGRQDVVVNS